VTDLNAKIDALPEWPNETNYAKQFRLASGVDVSYSFPEDDFKFMQDSMDAALARLALAREQIAADCLHSNCPHQFNRPGADCSCARSALLAALEAPR